MASHISQDARDACPPINLICLHYHNAIRAEFGRMAQSAKELEKLPAGKLFEQLATMRTQCRFLEKICTYHSSVEDEVGARIPYREDLLKEAM